ncbi:MAG: carbohydrate kinase [candidate division KSB1 bacterium]|nr:carbohydrate kinase [candidate division KSB1 bacterium]MDZ7368716.1 carbohydrate kinase [candidate division KSB1 bacterium]MDZ7406543.1 carbohydrate kinase [candidate division KSB1 bacterium]
MNQPREKWIVVGIGEVVWDIYRDGRHVGGGPANFAIHAAQLGDQGVLVSRVGDDGMGRELLGVLRQRRLPLEYVQIDPKKMTGAVMVTLDVKGIPNFRCSHDVAFDCLQYTPELEALAPRADAVMFGVIAQRSPAPRKTIWRFLQAAQKAIRLFDMSSPATAAAFPEIVQHSLEAANVVKMNQVELKLLQRLLHRTSDSPRKFIDFLIKKFSLKIVAVTYGHAGCELFDASSACRVEGLPVHAIDTTGAGDAFAAALVHKLLRGAPLREIAEFANILGAFLCTHKGATPIFRLEDVDAFRESL